MGFISVAETLWWLNMRSRREKAKNRKELGSFSAIPHSVTNSSNYRSLSSKAVKLLIDTIARYNGKNNGDFDYTFTNMKKWGWKSNDTIAKAKKELMQKGWIVLTKQGGLGIGPSLYALTIWPVDECNGKIDHKPTSRALGYWKK